MDAAGNEIDDAGAVALAKVLESGQSQLKSLEISDNKIGDAGAVALAKALESGQCQLKSLFLNANKIGDTGAAALATALESGQCQLEDLHLNENKIGEAGAVTLRKALESEQCKLIRLDLENVADDSEQELTLAEPAALAAATEVALPLPVKVGPMVSQPASFLEVRSLRTDPTHKRGTRAKGAPVAEVDSSPRRVRSSSVQTLCFAAHRGDTATIENLLDRPVRLDEHGELGEYGEAATQVNATNARGLAALHWAVAGRQHAATALLLERNANVSLKDTNTRIGRTALHYATDCLMLELLLQAGADHEAEDALGHTAAQHHAQNQRTELSDFVSLVPKTWCSGQ